MRELTQVEVQQVNGGNPAVIIAGAVAAYGAASIVYDFTRGLIAGYQAA